MEPSSLAVVLYKIFCMAMMIFIQGGFLLLESGLTREKNSYHVAIKNVVNFFLSGLIYAVVGVYVAGAFNAQAPDHWDLIFGTMFCSIATTIVSGSIAERCRFDGYLIMVMISSALIYPVAVRLCWSPGGFFTNLNFIDKAGSTVVHVCGGSMALAAAIVLGPRKLFFGRGQDLTPVPASNMTLACLASFFMVVGWLGFNLGSLDPTQFVDLDTYIINIFAGAAGGAITGLLLGRSKEGLYNIQSVLNGAISGLVAITAGFHLITSTGSLVLGSVGALAAARAEKWLLNRRIDDAIGAFPVHVAAGFVGTTGLVFFTSNDAFWRQLLVQVVASVSMGVWAFLVMYFLLKFIDRYFFPLRVSEKAEEDGLNLSEHNAPSLADLLCRDIDSHIKTLDFSKPVYSEPFTKIGRIADQYNRLTERLQDVLKKSLSEFSRLGELGLQVAGIAHDLRTPVHILSAQSYLLKSGDMSPTDQAVASKVISIECKRIETMCQLLLDRAHAKKQDQIPECSFLEALQDLSYLQSSSLTKSGIQLELPFEDYALVIDKSDLVRVLNNLIGNAEKAIKSTPSRHENAWIRVRVNADSGFLNIRVEDNGPGIPEGQQDRIFRLYLSDEHIHRQHGFGLAICESLLSRNGGSIELLSRQSPTTFQIKIPLKERH